MNGEIEEVKEYELIFELYSRIVDKHRLEPMMLFGVDDFPQLWNEFFKEIMGFTAPSDADVRASVKCKETRQSLISMIYEAADCMSSHMGECEICMRMSLDIDPCCKTLEDEDEETH